MKRTRKNSKPDMVFGTDAVTEIARYTLRQVDGREAFNQCFEYVITIDGPLEYEIPDEQLSQLLSKPAYIAFGIQDSGGQSSSDEADEVFHVWGRVRHIEMASVSEDRPSATYQLTLVPRLWDLGKIHRSAVYQNTSVVDIVKSVFDEFGLVDKQDYELRASQKHPEREYVVQYDESDLAFVSRLLESEGMYFFFEHDAEREKIIVGDTNASLREREGARYVPYDARGSTQGRGEAVTALRRRLGVVPATIELRDYNDATADQKLVVEAPVDKKFGIGREHHFGEHFTDPADGARLAKIRAQEALAWRDVFDAHSRVRALHPGHHFCLEGHPSGRFDRDYLVVEATHRVRQGDDAAAAGAARLGSGYEGTLSLIPFDKEQHFRPRRVTKKPKIYGLTTGKVDGDTQGLATPVDSLGRYKVQFPWDVRMKPAGAQSSRWIRRAQPSNGPEFGVHLPLHVGTEVVIAHIDGDPDRPVIVGSVPNSVTNSPVTMSNSTQAMLKTRAGIEIRFEDSQ